MESEEKYWPDPGAKYSLSVIHVLRASCTLSTLKDNLSQMDLYVLTPYTCKVW